MNRALFFDRVRNDPFSGSLSQSAVDGLSALVSAFDQYGDGDVRKLAYVLGTAFHECDRFRTMEEYASGAAYEGRADLGNTETGDGRRFKGRGFVQLTGRANYSDWSDRLDMDLIANPGLVKERDIAARICVEGMMLGTFTGVDLPRYIDESGADFHNARRVVNGTDRASMLAGYARGFLDALEAADYGEPTPPSSPQSTEADSPKEPTMETPKRRNATKEGGKGAAEAGGLLMPGVAVSIIIQAVGWEPQGVDPMTFGAAVVSVVTYGTAIIARAIAARNPD